MPRRLKLLIHAPAALASNPVMPELDPSRDPDPTADYRKYPKGPNFLGIVIGASVFLILAFVVIYLFLHHDASKLMPHGPNPTPNSLVRPLLPPAIPSIAIQG